MDEVKLPNGVTEEKIAEWKAKYPGKVGMLILPVDEFNQEHFSCIARDPDRTIIGEYLKYSDNNPNKANDLLVKNCLLSGYEEVKANDRLFFAALTELADRIPISKGQYVKL